MPDEIKVYLAIPVPIALKEDFNYSFYNIGISCYRLGFLQTTQQFFKNESFTHIKSADDATDQIEFIQEKIIQTLSNINNREKSNIDLIRATF
ncbi:MAG: hypothetical protein CMF49_00320 [Legionellales bacterium]|nr:hypothetical protein [Legionellales bacterium]|tara:strand:+ start:254 stop:532 length:279 start_codon:yes stop_codon:yes gene_type:complete